MYFYFFKEDFQVAPVLTWGSSERGCQSPECSPVERDVDKEREMVLQLITGRGRMTSLLTLGPGLFCHCSWDQYKETVGVSDKGQGTVFISFQACGTLL